MAKCVLSVPFRSHNVDATSRVLTEKTSVVVAISPDAKTVAIGWERDLLMYSTGDGTLERIISGVHSGELPYL